MKQKKLNVWWKILIIISLFILAALSGYVYGMATSKPVKKTKTISVKQEKTEKKEVTHNRLNQEIKLSNGLVLKVKAINRYTEIEGLDDAVGITIQVSNNTKKDHEFPPKYKFNLLFDKTSLSSIGIYDADKLEVNTLESVGDKINAGTTINVVYMYKPNEAKDLNAYEAELIIKDENKQHIISLNLDSKEFPKASDIENQNEEGTVNETNRTSTPSAYNNEQNNGYNNGYNNQNRQNYNNNQDNNNVNQGNAGYQQNNNQNYQGGAVNQNNAGVQGNQGYGANAQVGAVR